MTPAFHSNRSGFRQGRGAILARASVLVLLGLGWGCARGQQAQSRVDRADLERAADEWDRLFNSGQLVELATLYSDEAVSMPFNAPTVRGRSALQAEFERFFRENDDVRHETFVDEVLATPDWAIERARYALTSTPKSDGKTVMESGRHVMCRRRLDGRWQIVWELFNTDRPAT